MRVFGQLFIALMVSLAVMVSLAFGFASSMVYADGDNTTSASGSDVPSESRTVRQDVYFMGDVGVGTTSPLTLLHAEGRTATLTLKSTYTSLSNAILNFHTEDGFEYSPWFKKDISYV